MFPLYRFSVFCGPLAWPGCFPLSPLSWTHTNPPLSLPRPFAPVHTPSGWLPPCEMPKQTAFLNVGFQQREFHSWNLHVMCVLCYPLLSVWSGEVLEGCFVMRRLCCFSCDNQYKEFIWSLNVLMPIPLSHSSSVCLESSGGLEKKMIQLLVLSRFLCRDKLQSQVIKPVFADNQHWGCWKSFPS